MATNSEAGLVKIGNNEKATGTLDEEHSWHPVQLNDNNQAYVHVSSDAELWRKLYPNDFFTITPINNNTSDSFYGCKIFIPKIIELFKISHCKFDQTAPQDITYRSMYNIPNGYTCTIPEDERPIYKNKNSYIFLEAITSKGHFNLELKITPTDLNNQTFNATII